MKSHIINKTHRAADRLPSAPSTALMMQTMQQPWNNKPRWESSTIHDKIRVENMKSQISKKEQISFEET